MSWKPREKRHLRNKWSTVLNTAKVYSEIKPETSNPVNFPPRLHSNVRGRIRVYGAE